MPEFTSYHAQRRHRPPIPLVGGMPRQRLPLLSDERASEMFSQITPLQLAGEIVRLTKLLVIGCSVFRNFVAFRDKAVLKPLHGN
jgi:hypothetical protein